MATILDTILTRKNEEVSTLKSLHAAYGKRTLPRRPFINAIKSNTKLSIISEIKKASPSKGIICKDFDPVKIAQNYEQGGATALSVLTDEDFFQGRIDYLIQARAHTNLPVLRKDFIIDILQIEQSAHVNADAILLIAAALDDSQLKDLYQAAQGLNLDVLLEIHSFDELDRSMKINPSLLGINNRDLATFKVDIQLTIDLMKEIPKEIPVIAESGITGHEDARILADAKVAGLLVGESLMRSDNVIEKLQELLVDRYL